jgi:hypothetical protein
MSKPQSEQKRNRVTVRLNDAEYAFLMQQADVCSVTPSSFIRSRALGKVIVPQTDLRVLAELRRIGGLLKHIHNESNGAYSVQTADLLRQLSSYIRKLSRERETKEPRKQASKW